jgi:hypothetical protein
VNWNFGTGVDTVDLAGTGANQTITGTTNTQNPGANTLMQGANWTNTTTGNFP